jgi:hypothetical protein
VRVPHVNPTVSEEAGPQEGSGNLGQPQNAIPPPLTIQAPYPGELRFAVTPLDDHEQVNGFGQFLQESKEMGAAVGGILLVGLEDVAQLLL